MDRVGETGVNRLGSIMVIEEYYSSQNVLVRFTESGYKTRCTYQQFCNGTVKNVYDRTVFGVGYIGEGKYKPSANGKATIQYLTWYNMLKRCCDEKFKEECPTYKDCTVAEEWHSLQAFGKWFDENYYSVGKERMEIDKDCLIRGNKLYSPETCVFLPHKINTLIIKNDALRGEFPVGVKATSRNKDKYEARCSDNKGKRVYLGTFDSPIKAFNVYKEFKEKLIKEVLQEYKECIPVNVYNALIGYTVEIND